MDPAALAQEIKMKNLSDLHFVQGVVRSAPEASLYLLGVTPEIAKKISSLTPSEIDKLASVDILLFGPRFTNESIVQKLTEFATDENKYGATHAVLIAIGAKQLAAPLVI